MAKYLIQASYTASGAKGLAREGGSSRREKIKHMLEGMGGRLEVFYYAFGDADVYAIADMSDNVSAAAVSLAINASGAVATKTVVLMTPEDMDAAAKKSVQYSPPGA